ncbi:hypothetical protein K0M31_007349, partial [Melipona bicolor]
VVNSKNPKPVSGLALSNEITRGATSTAKNNQPNSNSGPWNFRNSWQLLEIPSEMPIAGKNSLDSL